MKEAAAQCCVPDRKAPPLDSPDRKAFPVEASLSGESDFPLSRWVICMRSLSRACPCSAPAISTARPCLDQVEICPWERSHMPPLVIAVSAPPLYPSTLSFAVLRSPCKACSPHVTFHFPPSLSHSITGHCANTVAHVLLMYRGVIACASRL